MEKYVIAPAPKESAELVELVARWDYERAVERIRPRIEKWAGITKELVRELFIARQYLNGQKGQRRDKDAPDYIWHTWNGFCEAVGISRQTANGFLRRFVPAETSANGEDKLYSPEEWKSLLPPDVPLTTREEERLIASFNKTGVRPEGWTKGLERIARERKEVEETKITLERWNGKLNIEAKRDYFADLRVIAGKNKRFILKDQDQIDAQLFMFRAIDAYLRLFKKLPDLLAASANLADKVRYVANYFAELLVDGTGQEGE